MATYSNSSLVNYTRISPNKNTTRVHEDFNPSGVIDKITIHHVAGVVSVETLGNIFAPTARQASSNYGIGNDGRVGLYVDEKHRAWTSGSPANDYHAITIEVSNDEMGGNWHVGDKAFNKLIELCVDICKRNGIKKLNYTGNASGNLTLHKFFQSTNCPGPYLESKMSYIADEVNRKLNPVCTGKITGYNTTRWTDYLVIYNKGKSTGTNIWGSEVAVNADGVATCAPVYGKGNMAIPTGGYVISGHGIASTWVKNNIKKGSQITISNGVIKVGAVVPIKPTTTTTTTTAGFKLGDEVKLVSGAKYTSGGAIPGWVFDKKLYVRDIRGNDIVISTLKSGAVTGVVASKYLVKYGSSATTKPQAAAPAPASSTLKVGDAVRIQNGAPVYGQSTKYQSWVYNTTLYILEINGSRVVVSTEKTGGIIGPVDKKYLTKM